VPRPAILTILTILTTLTILTVLTIPPWPDPTSLLPSPSPSSPSHPGFLPPVTRGVPLPGLAGRGRCWLYTALYCTALHAANGGPHCTLVAVQNSPRYCSTNSHNHNLLAQVAASYILWDIIQHCCFVGK
jgi:hypothetical protein